MGLTTVQLQRYCAACDEGSGSKRAGYGDII